MKYTPWAKITKVRPHMCHKSPNKQVLNCVIGGGKKKRATNLRDVRVPVNVANVVIGQASKEIDQMLRRCRTAC